MADMLEEKSRQKEDGQSLNKKDGDKLFEHYRNTLRNLGKELKP